MTEADNYNSQHRPLVGGIAIMSFAGSSQRGTLTAVARRNSDGAKVLVTNSHVITGDITAPHIST